MLLGACGGADEKAATEPSATSTAGTSTAPTSTATPDPDGFSPEQREVADAVDAYTQAFFGRGANPVRPALEGLVTKKVLDALVPAETKAIDSAGLQYIGDVTIDAKTVTIDKDTATFTGCRDSRAFVVKKGETTPGTGSRKVESSTMTFKLVRRGDRWLIDEPRGDPVNAC